jgi:rare lipoprotein A
MRRLVTAVLSAAALAAFLFAAFMAGVIWVTIPAHAGERQCGNASWYGAESGNRTANGERFDGSGMTAAHRALPFGTMLRVTDQATGRSVVVRVNDRGPYAGGRILDLSKEAARRLGTIPRGVARVCISPA